MKFITISSKIDITVTNGLANLDKTNYNSKIGNNINIAPLWTRTAVHIKKDKHRYPAEIASWQTVKTLEENGIFTIGAETDEGTPEEQQLLEEFNASKAATEAELSVKKRRKKSEETAE